MFRRRLPFLIILLNILPLESAAKLTIRDYFLLLPDNVMPDGAHTTAERKALLTGKSTQGYMRLITDDPANGYLSIGFDGRMQKGLFEFAIWRSEKGEDIIGINVIYSGVGGTDGTLHFYVLRNEQWKDVTQEVFGDFRVAAFKPKTDAPKICSESPVAEFPSGVSCKLPRKGLTIVCRYELFCDTPVNFKATDVYAKPVVNFHWQKNRFVAK